MANFQYEGATEGLSDNQYKFIENVLEKRGYTNNKVLIEAVGAAGDNYVACVKRIIVKDGENTFKMIAKVAPKMEKLRAMFNTHKLFYNEHLMYTEIIPQFETLEEDANISELQMIRFAECYGSYIDEPDELLLLEDLKDLNCVMLDRLKPLPEECLRSILKNLAIYHSFSFVLKHKKPKVFDKFKHDLFDIWRNFGNNEEGQKSLITVEDHILKLFSDNEETYKIVNGIITNIGENLTKLNEEDSGSAYTVIRHGDAWTNNFMFKFDGDTLQESIMIDYQVAAETSPTCDLLFLIFNCTDYQTRLKHFHEWIDYYYTELDKCLKKFNLNVDDIYPKEKLNEDLKRYGKAMCGLCCFFSYMLTLNSEDAAKVKESLNNVELNVADTANSVECKAKVEGIVDTCVKLGFI